MRRAFPGLAALLGASVVAAAAHGQAVSPAPGSVSLTIYRGGRVDAAILADPDSAPSGLVLVTEVRTIDIPAGRSKISFQGVSDSIIPQTAAIEGLPGAMIERNQDYDLLSAGSLVEKAVGKTVTLVRTNRETGEVTETRAVVRSGPDGVMLETDAGVEALSCSGGAERLVFDETPPGLTAKPTLSVVANSPEAGRYTVRLTYLAGGVNWGADYVARIRADGKTLDLTGWITLANIGGTTFLNAPTQVLAGNIERQDDTWPPEVEAQELETRCWPLHRDFAGEAQLVIPPPFREQRGGLIQDVPLAVSSFEQDEVEALVVTGSRIARQEELGDYKLYVLPDPTTVAARQTKQVLMMQEEAVPFERIYSFNVDMDMLSDDELNGKDAPATVWLRLQNRKEQGLGKPLPGGTVAIMEPTASGALLLAGDASFRDTPVGLPVELEMGEAMDVVVRATAREAEERGKKTRGVIEVAIANDKPVPITFELRNLAGVDLTGFSIVSASRRWTLDRGAALWTLRLQPGERTLIRYTIEADREQ